MRPSPMPPKRNLSVASGGSGLSEATPSKSNSWLWLLTAVIVVVAAVAVGKCVFPESLSFQRFGKHHVNQAPAFNANISRDVFLTELKAIRGQLFPSQDSRTWSESFSPFPDLRILDKGQHKHNG